MLKIRLCAPHRVLPVCAERVGGSVGKSPDDAATLRDGLCRCDTKNTGKSRGGYGPLGRFSGVLQAGNGVLVALYYPLDERFVAFAEVDKYDAEGAFYGGQRRQYGRIDHIGKLFR